MMRDALTGKSLTMGVLWGFAEGTARFWASAYLCDVGGARKTAIVLLRVERCRAMSKKRNQLEKALKTAIRKRRWCESKHRMADYLMWGAEINRLKGKLAELEE